MNVDELIVKISTVILNPIIAFLFVAATAVFMWGLINFFFIGEPKDQELGKKHIFYGLIGMFIMISVFGIMRLVANTIGANPSEFGASIPTNQ